jgi:glyceraldehyde-3-phosphate dehydrogenase/erythrose-4-phosphate dehydrogenase
MKKIAINGLGRIGRMVLRHFMDAAPKDLEIVAVNDLVGDHREAAVLNVVRCIHRSRWPLSLFTTFSPWGIGMYECR